MARNFSRVLIDAIAVCVTLIVQPLGSQCLQEQRTDPSVGVHKTLNTRDRAPLRRRDFTALPHVTMLLPTHTFGFDDHPKAT
ncbi:MAG TPA: hypothetical protein VED85_02865 [Burkholderiaceae bacterium]|nr:hypothetical protein [Burkholderiaceae bacterium]